MPNILLVEPDRELAEIISKYLSADYAVQVCTNAQEAISTADKNKPEVIILELAIPEHNGAAFLQELRSYQDWLDIPVIIYSRIARESIGLTPEEWEKFGVRG